MYRVMPLFVAIMRTGDKSLSRARFRKEKHSMSSIWTSSINNTWNQKPDNESRTIADKANVNAGTY